MTLEDDSRLPYSKSGSDPVISFIPGVVNFVMNMSSGT